MTRYIAFLRGINVGGHRIKMPRLRELFEELEFEDVSTFIASGNVIFSSGSEDVEELRKKIEAQLADRLGYDVPTFIRSLAELDAVVAHAQSEASEVDSGSSVYVIFLQKPASVDLSSKFGELKTEMDDFDVTGREVYWHIQGKLTDSPLFDRGLEKLMREVPHTTRNMTTLRRLVAKLRTGPAA
ncbi:MAG: DUF1697 domain-containing protein [Gemmatimonadales bacterium]|nr:MAG: DUF1697 domain-containing protein [Gemmatimonadales bacterium]